MQSLPQHVRSFNRQWTQRLHLLDQGVLGTSHSLVEARVIFELANRKSWERLELRDRLDIDPSFLTRILSRLEKQSLVGSGPSQQDGRRRVVWLTRPGRVAFKLLEQRSVAQIEAMLAPLTKGQQRTAGEAFTTLSNLFQPGSGLGEVSIRGLKPGDMGWVIQRHGEIYYDEYGWGARFEGLVARIVADYQHNYQPGRDNAWMAEVDGARAGCAFCCENDTVTARLRCLLVEPWARGRGLGRRLVNRCLRFARSAGYRRIVLSTDSHLDAARKIYQAAGFELVDEQANSTFGRGLKLQSWSRTLS